MKKTVIDFAEEDGVGGEKTHLVMVGDSLNDWHGYGNKGNAFLQVVRDKTGVITADNGPGGAWWR